MIYNFSVLQSFISASLFFLFIYVHSLRHCFYRNFHRYPGFVLITGASGGIGGSFAHICASKGKDLILTGRNSQVLLTLAKSLHNKFPEITILCIPADLASVKGCKQLCHSISMFIKNPVHFSESIAHPEICIFNLSKHIRPADSYRHNTLQPAGFSISEKRDIDFYRSASLGLIIHCAGIGDFQSFSAQSLESSISQVDLNCRSTVILVKQLLPLLKQNYVSIHGFLNRTPGQLSTRSGGVILVSSVLAQTPVPFASIYSASKSFTSSFGYSISLEFAPFGIDVFVSEPSATKTQFHSVAHNKQNILIHLSPDQVALLTLYNFFLGRSSSVFTSIDWITSIFLRFLPRSLSATLFAIPMSFWAGDTSF